MSPRPQRTACTCSASPLARRPVTGSASSMPHIRPTPRTSRTQGGCAGPRTGRGSAPPGRGRCPARRRAGRSRPPWRRPRRRVGCPRKVPVCAPGVHTSSRSSYMITATGMADAGERLRRDDHVGLDAVVLEGEPGAGAPAAGLHLVDDQRDVELAGERRAAAGRSRGRRGDDAALALHHLHHARPPAAGCRRWGRCRACSSTARQRVAQRLAAQPSGQRAQFEIREEVDARHPVRDRAPSARRGPLSAIAPCVLPWKPPWKAMIVAAAGRGLAQLDGRVDGVGARRTAEVRSSCGRRIAAGSIDSWASVKASLAGVGKSSPCTKRPSCSAARRDDLGVVVAERQHPRRR